MSPERPNRSRARSRVRVLHLAVFFLSRAGTAIIWSHSFVHVCVHLVQCLSILGRFYFQFAKELKDAEVTELF